MNQLLDFLFLRRPKLDYISPPVCEVIFTGSGGPIITLEDLERLLGPTGFRLGGRGHHWLSWNNYPGIICFNLYFSPSGNPLGPFELINECVPPSTVLVCSAGYYRVVTHVDGEPDIMSGWSFVDGSQYQQLDLPRAEGATSYDVNFAPPNAPLDADGNPETFFNVFQGVPPGGNAVETCQPGCYRITILVPLGETPPSEAQCEDFIPQICFQPRIYDPIRQACVLPGDCYETLCDVGFHFDQTICDCVANGGCTGLEFIDDLGINANIPAIEAARNGGYKGFQGGTPANFPWFYGDRVAQPIVNLIPGAGAGTGSLRMANSNQDVMGNTSSFFFGNAVTGSIQTFSFPVVVGSFAAPLRMQPDGSFMQASGPLPAREEAYVYQPATNDFQHILVPFTFSTQPYDMNASRVVCGSIVTAVSLHLKAVKITGGNTATDVPIPVDAPPIEANRQSRAMRINDLGSIAGWWQDLGGLGVQSPFVFTSGGGSVTIFNGDALFLSLYDAANLYITENDIVAGSMFDLNTGFTRAFIWQGGAATFLGDPADNIVVHGVNSSGVVLGRKDTDSGDAVVWLNGSWQTLGDLGMTAAGWSGINIGLSAGNNNLTDDGFIFGQGNLDGNSHGFAVKLCA